MDAKLLEQGHGQGRGQVRDEHVVLGEGREEVVGHGFVALPVHCVGEQVLGDEGAAGALPGVVRGGVVGGWEAQEVWRVGEGDRRCWGGACHGRIVCVVCVAMGDGG